jgi:hypothetical protein
MVMRFALAAMATLTATVACSTTQTSAGQLTAFSQSTEPCVAPCGGWDGYKATVDTTGHIAMHSMVGDATAVGTLTQLGSNQLAGMIAVLPIDADAGEGSGVMMALDIDLADGGTHSYAVPVDNPGFFGGLTVFLDDVATSMMDGQPSELVGAIVETD